MKGKHQLQKNFTRATAAFLLTGMFVGTLLSCKTEKPQGTASSWESVLPSPSVTESAQTPTSEPTSTPTPTPAPTPTPTNSGASGSLEPDNDPGMYDTDVEKKPAPENPSTSLEALTKRGNSWGISSITVCAEYVKGLDFDVTAYRDAEQKIFYLFLPCRVDLSKVVFLVTHRNKKTSGPYTADFSDDVVGENEKGIGTTSVYTIVAMQSNLPTIMLQVDETYGTVSAMNASKDHDVYCYGDMSLTVTDRMAAENGWSTRYLSVDEDESKPKSVKMRGRGNATWSYSAKKPYQFKTENKINLLGMSYGKTWCLLANWIDSPMLRNYTFYRFAQELGMAYTPEIHYVDFFLNGKYMGLYMLAEKVEVGAGRVEIDQTKDYLYEVNQYDYNKPFGFMSKKNNKIRLRSPEDDLTFGKAKAHLNYVEGLLYDTSSTDGLEYFDFASWAQVFLCHEIAMNPDSFLGSFYFYYNHLDGKIYAGPIWDFDYCLGNVRWDESANYPEKYTTRYNGWMKPMFQYTDFQREVVTQYYTGGFKEKMEALPETIRGYVEYILPSVRMNEIATEVFHYTDFTGSTSFEEDVEYMMGVLNARIIYINKFMSDLRGKVGINYVPLNKGQGTQDDPYRIENEVDYMLFAEGLKQGETYEGCFFVQKADLIMANSFAGLEEKYVFAGIYDGCGYSIHWDGKSATGSLFPTIHGTVMNLRLTGELTSTASTGAPLAVCVAEGGKVLNCISYSQVTAALASGLVGKAEKGAIISGCLFVGFSNGSFRSGFFVGNGKDGAQISHCYSLESCVKKAGDKNVIFLTDVKESERVMNATILQTAELAGVDASELCSFVWDIRRQSVELSKK